MVINRTEAIHQSGAQRKLGSLAHSLTLKLRVKASFHPLPCPSHAWPTLEEPWPAKTKSEREELGSDLSYFWLTLSFSFCCGSGFSFQKQKNHCFLRG